MAQAFTKDPSEVVEYTLDFTEELDAIGATISTATWAATSGITIDSSSVLSGNKKAQVVLSGGTAGVEYVVTCTIVTTGSSPVRTIKRGIFILCGSNPSAATDGLTTVGRVAFQLGVTDDDKLHMIARMIEEATAAIERYCNRTFKQATVTEKLVGYGRPYLMVSRMPLNSITSITYDGETVAASDYEIANSATGEIVHKNGVWNDTAKQTLNASLTEIPYSERKLYTVVYSGGYVLPGNASRTLPADIEAACVMVVSSMYSRRLDNPDIVKESLAGVASVEYGSASGNTSAQLPPAAAAILDKYRVPL